MQDGDNGLEASRVCSREQRLELPFRSRFLLAQGPPPPQPQPLAPQPPRVHFWYTFEGLGIVLGLERERCSRAYCLGRLLRDALRRRVCPQRPPRASRGPPGVQKRSPTHSQGPKIGLRRLISGWEFVGWEPMTCLRNGQELPRGSLSTHWRYPAYKLLAVL